MDFLKTWTYLLGIFLLIGSIVWSNEDEVEEIKAFTAATMTSLVVTSDVKYRYATTKFSMSYINPHSSPATASFYVNLPGRAYISNFTMNINGNVTVGQVKEKEEAKCIYRAAVESGQNVGIVKHRFTNVFDINVNIEPYATVVFDLIYQELLKRTLGKYSHVIHLTNKEEISNFLIEVFIKEPQDIINLVVPQIQSDLVTNESVFKALKTASVEYISNKEVYIKYEPTIQEQRKFNQSGITGLFKVLYDVDRGSNPNMVYAIDGYFVHFFAPDSDKTLAKNIVFMLDISGSMSGNKLKQLKEAMISILNSLNPEDDSFFLGFFSTRVSWINEDTIWPASRDNILYAIEYIQSLETKGSTNIYEALMQSVSRLNDIKSEEKKKLILFLTDGEPTEGEIRTSWIRKAVRNVNKNISLITLGFGQYCDFEFLKALASENGGFSRKIYFAADSQLQIENLYKEISTILMKNIQITYVDSAINTKRLTTTYFSNYFNGSELVISGPLSKNVGTHLKVIIQVETSSGPQNQTLKLQLDNFDFEAENFPRDPKLTSLQSLKKITRNTWVYLTLKKLLAGEITPKIKPKVISLSIKYGFVTPLTSMVVTNSNAPQCKSRPNLLLEKNVYLLSAYSNCSWIYRPVFSEVFFSMAFLIMTVLIFIVIFSSTTFRPLYLLTFFRCLSIEMFQPENSFLKVWLLIKQGIGEFIKMLSK